MSEHEFYKDGDADIPAAITDSHGAVCLLLCKTCDKAEGELADKCPGRKSSGVVTTEDALKKAATRKKHPRITMGQVAAILGVSPSMKRSTVLRDMVRAYHGAPSEYVANIAAEYNEDYRETAEAAFTNKYKLEVTKADTKKQHKILSSHPVTVESPKLGKVLLFIRTPYGQRSALDPEDFKSLDEQPHMFAQIQVEMLLAGVTKGIFFQWSALSSTFAVVDLDQAWLDTNLPQLDAFYAEYKEATKDKLHLEPLRKTIDNEKVRKLLSEWDDLCVAVGNANSRKAEIMAALKETAKDKSAILGDGRLLTKAEKKGAVSYADMVKKLLPNEDTEPYRGSPSESWTLT
jgi:hypothetical protein